MSDTPSDLGTPVSAPESTATRKTKKGRFGSDFKRFFLRGLAIILPTIATLALLAWTYGKIQLFIAEPINYGLRELVVNLAHWPNPTDEDYDAVYNADPTMQNQWQEEQKPTLVPNIIRPLASDYWPKQRRTWMKADPDIVHDARLYALEQKWNKIAIGKWRILNLIGLAIAVVVIYIIGVLLGSYIGKRLYARGEKLLDRVPLIRRIYPAFKQISEFIVPDPDDKEDSKIQFSRVVAVQYPRKGIWSVGLVTGDTMRNIQNAAGESCYTIFVPSSPTPFTGYVITVPKQDTVDLPITIEDALKFAISGGVLVPPAQQLDQTQTITDKSAKLASASASESQSPSTSDTE